MKIKKYLKKMTDYLNVDQQKFSNRKAYLEHILITLKKQKRKLKDQLKEETDEKRCKLLEEELDVVQTQRKKGLKILRALEKEQ